MTPLWSLILAVMAVAFCLGIYQAMQEAPTPKIWPMSDDDKALQAHFEKVEKDHVARLAHDREASKALNVILWRIIADYRAGIVPLEVATRAWDYERAHAEHSALWRGYLPVFQKNFTIEEMLA